MEDTYDHIDYCQDYSIFEQIGCGGFSQVYRAIHIQSKKAVVLKILKPIKRTRMDREVEILKFLSGGVNIVQFLDYAHFEDPKGTGIVFEKVGTYNFSQIYLTLSKGDIAFYMHEILKGVNYCHSMGVMHRDIKPQNLVINEEAKIIKLIDFGLAQFYESGRQYSVTIGTRQYMAPELLLGHGYYNYLVDLWSVGCIFAEMLLKRRPVFCGRDDTDQLIEIVTILGSEYLETYIEKYSISVDETLRQKIRLYPRSDFESFVNEANQPFANPDARSLLHSMLCYDHIHRITAEEALVAPYFSNLKSTEQQKQAGAMCPATSSKN